MCCRAVWLRSKRQSVSGAGWSCIRLTVLLRELKVTMGRMGLKTLLFTMGLCGAVPLTTAGLTPRVPLLVVLLSIMWVGLTSLCIWLKRPWPITPLQVGPLSGCLLHRWMILVVRSFSSLLPMRWLISKQLGVM